jgi:hypothetical protein
MLFKVLGVQLRSGKVGSASGGGEVKAVLCPFTLSNAYLLSAAQVHQSVHPEESMRRVTGLNDQVRHWQQVGQTVFWVVRVRSLGGML